MTSIRLIMFEPCLVVSQRLQINFRIIRRLFLDSVISLTEEQPEKKVGK